MSEDPAVLEVEAKYVKEVPEGEWAKEVAGEPLPVAVHFYSKDSKACEAFAPRFAAVAEKFSGKIRFAKVHQQSSPGLATRLGVSASPTVLFFVNGKEKGERLTGEDIKRTALKASVEALLGVSAAVPAAAEAGPRPA